MAKKTPGLFKRGQVWHIDKRYRGVTIRGSTHTGDIREAEAELNRRIEEVRQSLVYGVSRRVTWREAATKYLMESRKKSLDRDALALKHLDPWIGDLPLDHVHQGTLQPYIDHRLTEVRSGTVEREMAVVKNILGLAALLWRDENNRPWIPTAPLIRVEHKHPKAKPYPLSHVEQKALFRHMPDYLAEMALFAVNTGARDQVVCGLRWDWEVRIPDLGVSVFVTPETSEKGKREELYVLNSVARSVIDRQRGRHPEYVFTRGVEKGVSAGKRVPVSRMNNKAWRHAWGASGLPQGREWLRGPHNLKHTFGRRLRAAGVPLETRRALLHHATGDVTSHYSPAEVRELLEAVELITDAPPARVEAVK